MDRFDVVSPADLSAALAYALALPGQVPRADAAQVKTFRQYLEACPVAWEALRSGPPERPEAVFFALLLPGQTAMIMIPSPGDFGIVPDTQERITSAGLASLAPRHLHYAQVLLEPDADARRALLTRLGFHLLAPLEYLERDVVYPWFDPPAPGAAEWITYSAETHPDFARVISATYVDTLDCPELTGLRPIDDILAAHKASGFFDPALWELARIDGQFAGCLLLARLVHAPVLEVVYVGVVRDWRQRGVGNLLLRRALEQSRRLRARRLTTVVDDRNAPARRLYDSFAFTSIGRRDACLYRWT